MHEFPSPKDRLRRILQTSPLDGSRYVASTLEASGTQLVLRARTSQGRPAEFRFRGLRESETNLQPEPDSPLRLKSVGSGNKFSLVGMLLPFLKPPGPPYARVRIEAGAALLDIVCQDVEWWEEDAAQG